MSAINARCGASQQSIAEGDYCRVVLLSQAASFKALELDVDDKVETVIGVANTTVYPNCFWTPESPFIRAIYDDYGITKLVLETPLDRAQVANVFADFFRSTVRTRAGENQYHDNPFHFADFVRTQAPMLAALFEPLKWHSSVPPAKGSELDGELQKCWEYLCDLVRRHRVFKHGSGRFVRPVEMFIVHERAYQALAQDMDGRKDWNGNSYELSQLLRRGIAEARQEAADYKAVPLEGEDQAQAERFRGSVFVERLRSTVARLDVASCFTNRVARSAFDRDAHKVYEGTLSDDAFVEKAAVWMRDRSVICAMEVFEIKFMPMTYVGADFQNAVGSAYSRLIAQVSEQVTQDRKLANA